VVTREQIEKQTSTTTSVADIIANTVPGFSPSTEANTDFGQTLRGRKFLTLIDGVPQSTPLRDAQRSLNSIDPSTIERIEVVRGGTAAYGFGATGGTINIITKRAEDGKIRYYGAAGVGFSLTTSDSDSLQYKAQTGASGRQGAIDFVFDAAYSNRGSFFDADGDRIPSDPTGGVQGGLAESDTVSLLGKVGLNFDNDKQRLQFGVAYYNFEQDPEFGLASAGIPDQNIPTTALRGTVNVVNPGTKNLNLTAEYTNKDVFGSSLKAQFYYTDLEIQFGKSPILINPLLPFTFPQTQVQSEKLGGRVTINTPIDAIKPGTNVTWGLDVLQDKTAQTAADIETSLPGPNPFFVPNIVDFLDGRQPDPKLEQMAWAWFAQLEVPVTDKFKLSGGVRRETISVDVSDFVFINPFTFAPNNVSGGTLDFNETLYNITGSYEVVKGFEVYGGFSQSFTLNEIGRSVTTLGSVDDALAEAERADNYEVGLRMSGTSWDATIVGYESRSDNGISFSPTLQIQKQPERIRGVEVSANVRLSPTTRIGGTAAFINGVVDTNEDGDFNEDLPTTRIPPTKLTAYVEFSPTTWWSARLQALYSGNRDPDSTAFGGTESVESYVVVDAYSSFKIGPGNLEVGIKNLFNKDYTPVLNQAFDTSPVGVANAASLGYSRAPGRSMSLRYKVEF
ncbi:MAG: TonB-dependent receptor, partial [Pseudomonadota bacterium]